MKIHQIRLLLRTFLTVGMCAIAACGNAQVVGHAMTIEPARPGDLKGTNACAVDAGTSFIPYYEPQSVPRRAAGVAPLLDDAWVPSVATGWAGAVGMAFSADGASLLVRYTNTDAQGHLVPTWIEWNTNTGRQISRRYEQPGSPPLIAISHGNIVALDHTPLASYDLATSMPSPVTPYLSPDLSKKLLLRQLAHWHAREVMSIDAIDICDLATGELMWRAPFPTTDTALAVSNDGKVLITSIPVNDPAKRQTSIWRAGNNGVPQVIDGGPPFALSPDSTKLVYQLPAAGSVAILDLRDGRRVQLEARLLPSSQPIAFMFSPDGKSLMSFMNHAIEFWDVATGKYLQYAGQYPGRIWGGEPDPVPEAAWSRDGKTVAFSQEDGVVLIHVDNQPGLVRHVNGKSGRVAAMALSDDRQHLITGDESGNVEIRDTATWQVTQALHTQTPVDSVAIAHDGRKFALRDRSGRITIHDAKSGKQIGGSLDAGAAPGCGGMAFSQDGTALLSCGLSKMLVWRKLDGRDAPVKFSGKQYHAFASQSQVAFAPNGKTFAVNGPGFFDQGTLFDLERATSAYLAYPQNDCCESVVFSSDGKTIALGGDPVLYLLIKDDKVPLSASQPIPGSGRSEQVAMDAGRLGIGNQFVALTNTAEDETTQAIDFSADGKTLLTYSADRQKFEYWDVQSRSRSALHVPVVDLFSVRLLGDGHSIVGLGADGEVKVFDPLVLATDKTVRRLVVP